MFIVENVRGREHVQVFNLPIERIGTKSGRPFRELKGMVGRKGGGDGQQGLEKIRIVLNGEKTRGKSLETERGVTVIVEMSENSRWMIF